MKTATGVPRRGTAKDGIPEFRLDGLPITMDIGRGLTLGDGLGSMMPDGATLLFTTVGGLMRVAAGAGFLARGKRVRCMRPLWWFLLAVAGKQLGIMSRGS